MANGSIEGQTSQVDFWKGFISVMVYFIISLLSLSGDISLLRNVSKTPSGQYTFSELHLLSLNIYLGFSVFCLKADN